jgi:magnesium chelatase subunit D
MTGETGEEIDDLSQAEPSPQSVFDTGSNQWWEGGKQVKSGDEFTARSVDTPLDRLTRHTAGRRSRTITDRKRGRYVQSRPANGDLRDIAFDATIRAAAPFQVKRDKGELAYALETHDLHKKIRVKKSANLILFVVDASWSMAVAERMSATKGAIMSLLTDAYQRRDRVGLIVFHKDRAIEVLPPTNSVTLAKKALADIPVGGKTPLAAGLSLARDIFRRDKSSHPDSMPLMILLTDGAGNVSIGSGNPQGEAQRIAEMMKDDQIRSVVINMEHAAFDQGLAAKLAEDLGGPCYTLSELKAEILYETVRGELNR